MILVCSEASLSRESSWWVEREVKRAFAKAQKVQESGRTDRVLIPITIDGYLFDQGVCTHPFADDLRARICGDFSDPDRYDFELGRLVEVLRVAGPLGKPRMPPSILDPIDNPDLFEP